MAEVYGVKPKKFTREWWPYYWMYYKWHTIIIGFFAICTIAFVTQCATKTKYDLNVVYAGSGYYKSETTENLAKALSEAAIDADGNGEVNVFVEQINFSKGGSNGELDYSMQVKHDVEMSQETYMLYFYDKAELKIMLARDEASLVYMDVNDWADTEIDEDRLMYSDDGVPCAVNLDGNEFLAGLGMNTSDLYMAVRNTGSDKELAKNAHKGAVNAANLILGK